MNTIDHANAKEYIQNNVKKLWVQSVLYNNGETNLKKILGGDSGWFH